jgi:replicative DNA helicase
VPTLRSLARTPPAESLGRVAAVLDDAALDILATNDIFWDAVAEITPLASRKPTTRLCSGRTTSWPTASPYTTRWSKDADVVPLIHREDFYEPESRRAGEADLLVVKHRNGPTGTVTVAFQGHYSRFVDMAR